MIDKLKSYKSTIRGVVNSLKEIKVNAPYQSYLEADINKLTQLETKIANQVQKLNLPPEITLSDEYKMMHISQEIRQFCERMHLKNVRFTRKLKAPCFSYGDEQ